MVTAERRLESNLRKWLPLCQHIGLSIEKAQDGVFRCRVPLTEPNSNHFGTVHAALQFAALEVLGGMVVASIGLMQGKYLGVVKEFQIKFRAPAQTAIFAETNVSESELSRICSDAENQGRADFTLNSTLSDGNGNIFATGHGIYVIKLAQVPEELRY